MNPSLLLTLASAFSVTAAGLLSATSAARTQTPPAGPGSMLVVALIPAPSGTSVTVEALDVPTIRPVKCTTGLSSPVPGAVDGTSSQISVLINRSSCVEDHSGNLRVCWAANECSAFDYEDGKTVDRGLLSTNVVQYAPDGGSGATAGHEVPMICIGALSLFSEPVEPVSSRAD